jgi:hypothetical protein
VSPYKIDQNLFDLAQRIAENVVPNVSIFLGLIFFLDKTFVLFWGAYHAVSTVPYPVQGSQVTITPEKL